MAGDLDPRVARAEARLRPWLIAAALAALPGVYLASSKADGPRLIGEVVLALVWLAFAVEVVWLLSLTADRAAWVRSHRLELFVALTSIPGLSTLATGAGALKLVPALELLKLLKVVKLVKLRRFLGRSLGTSRRARRAQHAFVVVAAALAAALVVAVASDDKERSLADVLDHEWQLLTLLVAFVGIELWSSRRKDRT